MPNCIKIEYENIRDPQKPHMVLGVLIKENNDFLHIRTGARDLTIAKRLIYSISNTEEEFIEK